MSSADILLGIVSLSIVIVSTSLFVSLVVIATRPRKTRH